MASSPSAHVMSPGKASPDDASRPLSGPGTSRQIRRLQLRNAKFQASSLPTRKVTPQSQTASSNWSNAGGVQYSSDVENKSPRATGPDDVQPALYGSNAALQEIRNTSLPRPRRTGHRVSLGKLFGGGDSSNQDTIAKYDSTSPEAGHGPTPLSTSRVRTRTGHSRSSVSAETRKYIEHLENELSTAQSRLSAATSPSATREQTSRMRNLHAETRQLQEELAEWEAKYESRVEEEMDSHRETDVRLRSQIKFLEQEAEESQARMADLQAQLESTNQTLEAAETANVNLEKRIEIMSGILAAAPNKIDLHVEIPGRGRSDRPRSMLPRFPTAGALITSPDRQQPGHRHSNSISHVALAATSCDTPSRHLFSPVSSDVESIFSESSNGLAGAENPWGIPQAQHNKTKPMRRMRRFGAGSAGPKPLILPSTSQHEQYPASAPLLDRSEGEPAFPFPPPECPSTEPGDCSGAAIGGEKTEPRQLQSSIPPRMEDEEEADDTLLGLQSPCTSSGHKGADFSSLGQETGRNLLDELADINASDSGITDAHSLVHSRARDMASSFELSPSMKPSVSTIPAALSSPDVRLSTSRALIVPSDGRRWQHVRSRQGSILSHGYTPPLASGSALDRLNRLFSDLWRHPVFLARRLVQSAQGRLHLPNSLLDVQWWLVGVLFGPMARRRLLLEAAADRKSAAQPPPSADLDADTLAYGAMYKTPPSSPQPSLSSLSLSSAMHAAPNSVRSSSLVAGKGKKRAQPREREPMTAAVGGFKHSPWLWLKFSITLAFAVGVAFKDGPASLMQLQAPRKSGGGTARRRGANWKRTRRDPPLFLTP